MKLITVIYIALVLSLAIGVEYNFEGDDRLPTYWGSPFVFKQESIGTSLEYYYSISGFVANVVIWSLALLLLQKVMRKTNLNKKIKIIYQTSIVLIVIFSTFNIFWAYYTIGKSFDKKFNYWYWDINKEAQSYGGKYKGKLINFGK